MRSDRVETHMAQRDQSIDDDALPVMVPRNDRKLVPKSSERVRQLREFLIRTLRTTKDLNTVSHVRPEPEGFGAEVARAACSLCRGWCCRNGGDDAFLDEPTIARVRHADSALSARAVLRRYVERVPAMSYEGSCIFHAEQGCTLDRSLRSDLCNAYFCGGLQAYLTSGEAATATVVIAGEGNKMRTSPVIMPRRKPLNNDRRRT
jgi:hypothetical protein